MYQASGVEHDRRVATISDLQSALHELSGEARARSTAVFPGNVWFISICAAATHLGLARALDEPRHHEA